MYTKGQQRFIDLVLSGKNTFLTGVAGSGKSFIIREAISELINNGKKVAAVAPTGIAANNIDGQTIHSLFKLPPYGVLSFEAVNYVKQATRDVLRAIQVLVIDEVSMLRPDVLDGIHYTFIKNGLPGLHERQVIFVGDLKQLPPIYNDNTRAVLYQTYKGETFDFSNIWERLKCECIELDEVMRQSDPEFIAALNIVREGKKSEYFRQFVHTEPKGVILAPYNATVQVYNDNGLHAQEGKEFKFEAEIYGRIKPEELPFEKTIRVKSGCKIMYLVNSKDAPLRNGTLGTFIADGDNFFIRIGSIDYPLYRYEVTKKEYVYDKKKDCLNLEEIGSVCQYPFKLAYALTIHKSQGLTFSEVTVDLTRRCFQNGQLYVALSRATGPEALRIIIN